MKRGEIKRARKRHYDRKVAGGASNDRLAEHDESRRILSGLDLDLDELLKLSGDVVAAPIEASRAGVAPQDLLFGMWVDGLVVGLLLAEQRREEE